MEPDEPQPVDWYLEQQSKIVTMLSFLAGVSMSPDAIEASVDDSSHRVSVMIALQNIKCCSHTNLHEFFMPRSAMGTDLFTTINAWLNQHERVDKPSRLALSIFASEKLWYMLSSSR